MKSATLLAVVVVAVLVVGMAECKRKNKGKKSRQSHATHNHDTHNAHMAALDDRMQELSDRLDHMAAGSGGHDAATSGSCATGKVNLHFHGADVTADDVDADDTHIHISLDHGDHHGHGHDDDHHDSHHDDDHDSHYDHHDHHSMSDDDHELSAHCEMVAVGSNGVEGFVHIVQQHGGRAMFMLTMSYLNDGNTDHMLHVHQSGDLSNGCENIGGHYNPYHKGVDVGDLGTVTSGDDGEIDGAVINDTMLTLTGKFSILGRSIAIHGPDHAKIACCVIGWSADNMTQGAGHGMKHAHTMTKHGMHNRRRREAKMSMAEILNLKELS